AAQRDAVPLALRMGLGRIAAARKPVPPGWALAWAWYQPGVAPRVGATRRPEVFARLFAHRYHAQYGDGLIVKPGKQKLSLHYRPASQAIADGTLRSNTIPDVFSLAHPVADLVALFTLATMDMESYGRWAGRNPEKAESLAAVAQLPDDFPIATFGDVEPLATWLETSLDGDERVFATGDELMRFWPTTGEKLTRAESVSLAQIIGRLGHGIEPDPRFGGVPIARGSAIVVFREEPGAPREARSAYTTATLLVRLAAAVGTSDGNLSVHELEHLRSVIVSSLQLTPAEQIRLDAHLAWLTTSEIRLTGLKTKLEVLTPQQRTSIGDLLVAVAASDGAVSPAEVTTLMKLYKMLDLDPESVASHLHARLTSSPPRPATRPVTVRPAGIPEPGFPIPPPPSSTSAPQLVVSPKTSAFTLDEAAIRQKMADTAAVSALLGSIFADDETDVLQSPGGALGERPAIPVTPGIAPDGRPPASVDLVAGLDAVHSAVLRTLATKPAWEAEAFASLASSHDLMPNGALDVLNESAFEIAGEPLLEGDDPLTVNAYALEAMLA
ncbi:MAG TPA: tellurite resistance TerB C-terminal domain-containing protein, partial [Thermomicrobiales bacterium]|nr:tellurite resistance TerB C-terminal domain-containing protein [Thermomicrobiales bacterium]